MVKSRPVLAIALAASFALPSFAQEVETGIALALADELEPWEETGGWIAVPAGTLPIGKSGQLNTEMSASLAPGDYDIYWDQNDRSEPLPVATAVTVVADEVTEIRVTTGFALELAEWVLPRDPETGVLGVLPPEATAFDFIVQSATANALFLPPGDYYVYYHPGGDDDRPPTLIGAAFVEAPFGGLGVEVGAEDGRIVVVRTLPGGAAEAAGLAAGDIILGVDGIDLTGLELADAVAELRGDAGAPVTLTVQRGKQSLDFAFTRTVVEPFDIVEATSGIRLLSEAGVLQDEGWWGVVYAGNAVETLDDIIQWRMGSESTPLLLGPASYDLYWSPDGVTPPILIEAGIDLNGELVEIAAETPN